MYFLILDASKTQDKTGTADSTKISTLVTPEKNDKNRKNMEGMGDINDVHGSDDSFAVDMSWYKKVGYTQYAKISNFKRHI